MLIYAGTKSAQMNWVRNLARHVGPHGVTINNLAPGVIFTGRNAPRLSEPAHRERTEQRIPLGRLGSPDDLVGAALLLCSDAGSYINGATWWWTEASEWPDRQSTHPMPYANSTIRSSTRLSSARSQLFARRGPASPDTGRSISARGVRR
jgi:hypothetical protein